MGLALALLVAGAWLRVWTIGHNDLWFDEAFTRNVVIYGGVPAILRGEIGDLLPPLHFLLLGAWTGLAGDSAIAMRMLSALVSVLALPAVYRLGRLLFGQRAGLAALLLAALSPLQIYYAQEVRFYALSVSLSAWSFVGLVALLRSKRYGVPLYVLAAAGSLYTHYFAGLALAAAHVWLLLHAPARRLWRRWLLADVVIALLFVPQLFTFLRQAGAVLGSFWIAGPNPAAPITTLTFLLFGMTLPRGVDFVAVILVVCAIVIGAFDVLTRAPGRIRAAWLLCMGAILLTLSSALVISLARSSIYLDRSFSLLSPLLLAGLAASAVWARRPSPGPLLVGGLVALMFVGILNHALAPDPAKPPFDRIARDLADGTVGPTAPTPIYYLHDSVPLSINYYVPALARAGRVVDLGDRSWLFPQILIFPDSWRLFGIERLPREQMAQELETQEGRFRVVITANLEPPDQATLRALLTRNCLIARTEYPPFVTVFEFTCQ